MVEFPLGNAAIGQPDNADENGQPLGGLAGEGTSPPKRMRCRFESGSTTGTAEISAWV
jgi:hypothetical protein